MTKCTLPTLHASAGTCERVNHLRITAYDARRGRFRASRLTTHRRRQVSPRRAGSTRGRGQRQSHDGRGNIGRRGAQERADSLVGTDLELTIGPPAHGGFCVSRHEGRVVFVRHTLPGERVIARVTEGGESSRFLRADAVAVLDASPDRVEPVCRHAGPPRTDGSGGCGGCDWQHASLPAQRRLAAAVVAEQFQRLAGLEVPVVVQPVPGDVAGFEWRTRVEFAVSPSGRAGLRPARSHDLIPLEECPISHPRVLESLVLQADWRDSRAVDVIAPSDGETVVVPIPRRRAEQPRTVPIVREKVTTPAGEWSYAVSARGFWQVHPGAAATFVTRVMEVLAPKHGDRVLDLYAGVGLFALPLAEAVGETGSVIAVEGDAIACEQARLNGASQPQITVIEGRVETELASLGSQLGSQPVDLVVLDPPRSGAGRDVMAALCARGPRVIAYVACDPAAVARDTAYAMEHGYRLAELTAYDAFPMTHHVECIAVLVPA